MHEVGFNQLNWQSPSACENRNYHGSFNGLARSGVRAGVTGQTRAAAGTACRSAAPSLAATPIYRGAARARGIKDQALAAPPEGKTKAKPNEPSTAGSASKSSEARSLLD